ncbi:MAG: aromatic amino acid lyase [Nocardioidaceae bacterium]
MHTRLQRSLVRSPPPVPARGRARGRRPDAAAVDAGYRAHQRTAGPLALADLLTHGITPVVRVTGALGCSADLAPPPRPLRPGAAGEGSVRDAAGVLMPAAEALAAAGLAPVEHHLAKEGLALINGTDGMLGMLVMAVTDLRMLLRTADVAAAMSVEGQARDGPGVAPPPRAGAAAGWVRPVGRQPDRPPATPGWSPRTGGPTATASRTLLAALLAPGARGPPATPSSMPPSSRDAGGERHRPGRPRRAGTGRSAAFHGAPVAYVLDFLAIVSADVARSPSATPTGSSTGPVHGLPPFWPTTPASTAGA